MSVKIPAAAAAILQLQLHQHPCESIQTVELPLCTKFGDDECITSQITQYAAFYSFIFEKSTAAVATVLQLLYCSCSSRTSIIQIVAALVAKRKQQQQQQQRKQ